MKRKDHKTRRIDRTEDRQTIEDAERQALSHTGRRERGSLLFV